MNWEAFIVGFCLSCCGVVNIYVMVSLIRMSKKVDAFYYAALRKIQDCGRPDR